MSEEYVSHAQLVATRAEREAELMKAYEPKIKQQLDREEALQLTRELSTELQEVVHSQAVREVPREHRIDTDNSIYTEYAHPLVAIVEGGTVTLYYLGHNEIYRGHLLTQSFHEDPWELLRSSGVHDRLFAEVLVYKDDLSMYYPLTPSNTHLKLVLEAVRELVA